MAPKKPEVRSRKTIAFVAAAIVLTCAVYLVAQSVQELRSDENAQDEKADTTNVAGRSARAFFHDDAFGGDAPASPPNSPEEQKKLPATGTVFDPSDLILRPMDERGIITIPAEEAEGKTKWWKKGKAKVLYEIDDEEWDSYDVPSKCPKGPNCLSCHKVEDLP